MSKLSLKSLFSEMKYMLRKYLQQDRAQMIYLRTKVFKNAHIKHTMGTHVKLKL